MVLSTLLRGYAMQYVTYAQLFQLLLVLIGKIGLAVGIVRTHKKK